MIVENSKDSTKWLLGVKPVHRISIQKKKKKNVFMYVPVIKNWKSKILNILYITAPRVIKYLGISLTKYVCVLKTTYWGKKPKRPWKMKIHNHVHGLKTHCYDLSSLQIDL